MKRLALIILLAAATRSSAADLPLPTGFAPTSPSVPAPVFQGGLPAEQVSFRDKLGIGSDCDSGACGPRSLSRALSWRPFKNCALCQTPTWCENCAPAVKRPLPPLPAGLSAGHMVASEPRAKHDGSCCQKLKEWLCFHYTPVRTPLVPNPKQPALWTYFPTMEGAGIGGCADGSCGKGRACGAAKTCATCPAPGEAIIPGFRLANPEK